jgi:hypothetical protein
MGEVGAFGWCLRAADVARGSPELPSHKNYRHLPDFKIKTKNCFVFVAVVNGLLWSRLVHYVQDASGSSLKIF